MIATLAPPSRPRAAPGRRGMLLLLVLGILALFLIVGAVGILLAIRARESARAFAAASADQSASSSLARAQLDEALLRLVRGTSPAGLAIPTGGNAESLLLDKYGTSQSCTVTAIASTGPFIQVQTSLNTANPAAFAGCVFTFDPGVGDVTGPTSYRIVRADKGTGVLWLANVRPSTPLPLPTLALSGGTCGGIVNGREFAGTGTGTNEPYDAFDAQNPFLTWPALQGSRVASVQRPAFGAANAPCTVDNDGDGVADGVWLAGALPPQRAGGGGQLTFDVSYLVLDLDGRINLNAHGSSMRAQAPQGSYPQPVTTVPPGMGYGPADVDAALLVATPAEIGSGNVPARWQLMVAGGNATANALVSSGSQWRPTPRAEAVQPGRYSIDQFPGGLLGLTAAPISGTNPLNADFWMVNAYAGNSPTDLKAQLQVFTQGSPPTLTFARPAAWPNAAVITGAMAAQDDVLGANAAAHPYRMRLDEDAPRAAGYFAADAPFTVGELERVLRPFDSDAATLAPRLAALLDDLAETSRMTVTTDSWDTPAVTGNAAIQIVNAAAGYSADPNAVMSPETVAGLRLNVNRPLVSAAARQELFRHLFTLAVTLGAAANDATAQWVANVLEFRDADSVMTWYPYDTNPTDGWTTGTTGVWGAERPELVITSAAASGNTATVKLYRPWAAACVSASGTAAAEPIDPSLGNVAANTLDATRAVSGSTAVWQLSIGGSATGLATLMSSATAVGTNTEAGTATISGTSPPTQVVLQRLADPTKAYDGNPANATYNDYVVVHQVSVPSSASVSRWLHWPNRDLVSHGELLAVQSGSAATLAQVAVGRATEASLARTVPAILEATITPSRFVGANVSVANAATQLPVGMQNMPYGQFSRWREPGRVNVNTILPNTGNTPNTLDNAVWSALVGVSGQSNPVTATAGAYNPIKSDRDLLVSGGDAVMPRSGATAASAFLSRATAIRLASVATTRSNVFAVWITLRITDSSANGGSPRFTRLFAIVDRSVPVGFVPGRTLNARETIRLQRFLE